MIPTCTSTRLVQVRQHHIIPQALIPTLLSAAAAVVIPNHGTWHTFLIKVHFFCSRHVDRLPRYIHTGSFVALLAGHMCISFCSDWPCVVFQRFSAWRFRIGLFDARSEDASIDFAYPLSASIYLVSFLYVRNSSSTTAVFDFEHMINRSPPASGLYTYLQMIHTSNKYYHSSDNNAMLLLLQKNYCMYLVRVYLAPGVNCAGWRRLCAVRVLSSHFFWTLVYYHATAVYLVLRSILLLCVHFFVDAKVPNRRTTAVAGVT